MSNLIGQQLGNYEVLSVLGKGGMATVYRARQLNIKREVAIKVIKPDLAESVDFTKRFEREAETIAALGHPHILKLFDYGQHGDMVYLVMELLKGGSLADLIRRGPLPLETVSLILDQICSALEYAHQQGLIHRDLKPQNVLLDVQGNAFLTDFGIARLISQSTALTQSGVAMGTPAYMSPEQWKGQNYDARADIYALGVMLFEMLTGQLPFNAEAPGQMVYLHLYEPPPAVSALRPDLSPAIESVVNKALAKNADERFQTAIELAEAFRAAVSGQMVTSPHYSPGVSKIVSRPVLARSTPSTGQPTQTAPRRSNTSALLGIGVVAFVLILLGGSIAVMLGGRAGPTATPTPSNTVIMLPTVPIAATTPIPPPVQIAAGVTPSATEASNLETHAALTFEAMTTLTANAMPTVTSSQTPNEAETINALLAQTLTALAPKSATPTASSTPSPTLTPSPSVSSQPTPTLTETPFPPTNTLSITPSSSPIASEVTRTASPTATPTQAGTAVALAPVLSAISVSNAQDVRLLNTLQSQSGTVISVAFSPDGTLLAAATDQGIVQLWDVTAGTLRTALKGHLRSVNAVRFSPDGTLLASGSDDKTVRLWDVKTGQQRVLLQGHDNGVLSVAFSPDGALLASGAYDNTVRLWDTKSGQQKAVFSGHEKSVWSVAFSPDGTLVASGSADGTARLWDVKSGQQKAVLKGHTGHVFSVSFSPDGSLLASGGEDKTIRLWDVATAQQQAIITGHNGQVNSVAFNPAGSLLASGSSDKIIKLWDVKTGKELASLSSSDSNAVNSVAFNADGSLLASGGSEQMVRLWGLSSDLGSPTITPPAVTPIPCTVVTDQANIIAIRVGPGKSRGLRDYMAANKPYQVIGQAQASDGSAWWKLKTDDNSEAWVAQTDVKASGDCGQIGVVATPQVQKPRPSNTPVRGGGKPGGNGNSGGGPAPQPTAPPGQPTYTPFPNCGNQGQTCCAGGSCYGGLTCQSGVCSPPPPCGDVGQACCDGTTCYGNLTCQSGVCNQTVVCGDVGQACCGGSTCNSGLTCQGGVCGNPPPPPPCGADGEACCSGGGCNSGLVCQGGYCSAPSTCGGPGQPLCP